MLGRTLHDPEGIEGPASRTESMLGVLNISTRMRSEKLTVGVDVDIVDLAEPFATLNGVRVAGYEIRHGAIDPGDGITTRGSSMWQAGNVLATAVHGLFESPEVIRRLFDIRVTPVLDETFTLLADAVEEHLDTRLLRDITGA